MEFNYQPKQAYHVSWLARAATLKSSRRLALPRDSLKAMLFAAFDERREKDSPTPGADCDPLALRGREAMEEDKAEPLLHRMSAKR